MFQLVEPLFSYKHLSTIIKFVPYCDVCPIILAKTSLSGEHLENNACQLLGQLLLNALLACSFRANGQWTANVCAFIVSNGSIEAGDFGEQWIIRHTSSPWVGKSAHYCLLGPSAVIDHDRMATDRPQNVTAIKSSQHRVHHKSISFLRLPLCPFSPHSSRCTAALSAKPVLSWESWEWVECSAQQHDH